MLMIFPYQEGGDIGGWRIAFKQETPDPEEVARSGVYQPFLRSEAMGGGRLPIDWLFL